MRRKLIRLFANTRSSKERNLHLCCDGFNLSKGVFHLYSLVNADVFYGKIFIGNMTVQFWPHSEMSKLWEEMKINGGAGVPRQPGGFITEATHAIPLQSFLYTEQHKHTAWFIWSLIFHLEKLSRCFTSHALILGRNSTIYYRKKDLLSD